MPTPGMEATSKVLPPEAHDAPTPPRNVVAWPGAVRGGRPAPPPPRRRPRSRRGFPLRLLVLAAVLFAGLMRTTPDGQVAPDLAERWEVSPDGRTYTFRLRPGLRWSDGTPLDAHDVVFTYD